MKKYCLVKPKVVILGVGERPFDKEQKMVLVGREIMSCMNAGIVNEILKDGTLRQLYKENYLNVDDKTVIDFENLPEIKDPASPPPEPSPEESKENLRMSKGRSIPSSSYTSNTKSEQKESTNSTENNKK